MFRRPSLLSDISSLRSLSGSDGSAASASLGPSPLDEIAAPPRELASEEVEELSSLIRGCLKLTNCACAIQAEEDASDFIDYAVDLIADGLCVISVLEELAFMDMIEICPPQSLDEMHAALPAFLGRLHEKDGREDPCKALQASSSASASASRGRRRLSQEIREGDTYLAAFDLSAKTAANKKRQELAAISGQGGSLKERIGSLQSSLANPRGGSDDNDALEGMDEAALKKKRERELNAIANDVSLTEKEKTNKMKEVRGKYGVLQMKMRIARAARARSSQSSGDEAKAEEAPKTSRAERELRPSKGRRSSIDLSAGGAVATKAKELALLRKQSGSLADRKGMYAEDGTLRNSFTNREIDLADLQREEDEAKEKTIDDMRREELLKVMKDKSLSRMEKTRAMDEVRARYEEAATSAAEEALDEAIGKAKLAVGCGGDTVTTVSSITDHPFNNSGNDLANTGSAFSSSPIDEIAAPHRDLTEEELNDLRALIKGCLKLNNVSCALDADADAIDLVNYGIDLITDGMSVGVILEEIDFMELEICPMASLEELRKPLANYFGKLHKNATGTNNPLDERAQKVVVSIPDREAACRRGRRTSIDGLIGSGVPRRRLSQEMREGSAFVKVDLSATTASTKKREELARLVKLTGSVKARMGMYSEDGERDMEGAPLASSTSGKESVPRAERELRPGKGRRSSIDLSAKSSVVTKATELALLRKQSGSLADRMGGMYAEDGTLRSRSSADKVEITHLGEEAQGKSTDELRREELLAVMRDRSLNREQKTRTMDLIREKYAPPEAIVGEKKQYSDEDNKSDKIEARRRKERVAIMRTKGLNTAERRARFEAVNRKQYCLTPSTRQ